MDPGCVGGMTGSRKRPEAPTDSTAERLAFFELVDEACSGGGDFERLGGVGAGQGRDNDGGVVGTVFVCAGLWGTWLAVDSL